MTRVSSHDPTRYDGALLKQHSRNFFTDVTGQVRVALWDTVAMRTSPLVFQSYEFMHVLEGRIRLDGTHDDWSDTFNAGDSPLKPKGTRYRWICDGYVRKISCVFQPG